MANVSNFLGAQMLNWSLRGANPSQPAATYIGIGLSAPTSTSGNELTTGSGMTRQTVAFGTASTSSVLVTNNVAATLGPISAAATIVGAVVYDLITALTGDLLYYGTLTTSRTMASGDSLVFAAGALQATIT